MKSLKCVQTSAVDIKFLPIVTEMGHHSTLMDNSVINGTLDF